MTALESATFTKQLIAEEALKNLSDLLKDGDKFNLLIQNFFWLIPQEGQLGKRALMILISDAIDASNQIDIEEEEMEEFVDCYLMEYFNYPIGPLNVSAQMKSDGPKYCDDLSDFDNE